MNAATPRPRTAKTTAKKKPRKPATAASAPVARIRKTAATPSAETIVQDGTARTDVLGHFSEGRYLEREISWLQFNERVLSLALDDNVPLLERARFLAIFATNLDEFFMVRVAGLKRRIDTGLAVRSASGMEPKELLADILAAAHPLMQEHAATFHKVIRPALAEEGIHLIDVNDWTDSDRAWLQDYYTNLVFPVLTPLGVDPAHPFPYVSGLSLNLAITLRNPESGREHFARLKVPPVFPRMLRLPDNGDMLSGRFVLMEDLIAENLDSLFPNMEVTEHFTFRVTRNEDVEVEEDEAENLLKALEKGLERRRFGAPVRLEVANNISDRTLRLLTEEIGIDQKDVYRLPEPLDLSSLWGLSTERSGLEWPHFMARTHPDLSPVERAAAPDVLAAMDKQDILLHHPYDSFSTSVQRFIEQAAEDPKVLAIKQTLYRTSGDSPIINALISAARSGKQVLAVVEIKARFDEENNILWARKLEKQGVHVVYGMVGLKTHAKLSMAIRQEGKTLRRYCHVGTGNYNPKTARIYEDLGLLTTDPEVADDMSRLFNQLSGMAPAAGFNRLLVAPVTVRTGIIAGIEKAIAAKAAGKQVRVSIKVNSLVDERFIEACYRASQAGVPVRIWVRGICALRPGVEGMSENIEVRSILGRYLEHSRIFITEIEGEDPLVYIGSADMMHRNLDRRVEALVRLSEPQQKATLIELIDQGMSSDISSWSLGADGRWTRHNVHADGTQKTDIQAALIKQYSNHRRRRQPNR